MRLESSEAIMIIGAPRSGTTWLAKILDSHPQTLYRHEPDLVCPSEVLPHQLPRTQAHDWVQVAQEYLASLCSTRDLRVVGKRPIFTKDYRSRQANIVYRMMVLLLLSLDRISGFVTRTRCQIPDLIDRPSVPLRVVLKSVISMGRASVYREALSRGTIIFIVRHPCAFVASELRGARLGVMVDPVRDDVLERADADVGLGIAEVDTRRLTPAARWAWFWAVMNEKAMNALLGADNVIVVKHEDLCRDPAGETRRIFSKCGLEWFPQVAEFISVSSKGENGSSYYGVVRSSLDEIEKWKEELTQSQVEDIVCIAKRSSIWGNYFDGAVDVPI